jgi:hypothetical protein
VTRPIRLAAICLSAVAVVIMSIAPASASTSVPYDDPSVVGYLGLCDASGHQITHGSIHTTPLAWRAVSSSAAPAPYNAPGRTATLYAYQPRKGLPPGEWSGEQLTATSRYTNPAHPMVATTSRDDSLAYFTSDFHPAWDGLVQLRIYLGAPDQEPYSYRYAALDLKVTGSTWHAVEGGAVSCHDGSAVSVASILLPSPTPRSHHTTHAKGGATAVPKSSAGPRKDAGPRESAVPGASSEPAAADAAPASSSGHGTAIAIWTIVAVLVVAAVAYLLNRRRRLAAHGSPPTPSNNRAPKGQS